MVQITILQLLCHPLFLVLLGRKCLRGIMAVSMMMLEGVTGMALTQTIHSAPNLNKCSEHWEDYTPPENISSGNMKAVLARRV